MLPRSLLIPPGIPDFLSRVRVMPSGEHQLCCRAIDAAGARQPLEPQWNLGGDTNNAVHRVKVHVTDA